MSWAFLFINLPLPLFKDMFFHAVGLPENCIIFNHSRPFKNLWKLYPKVNTKGIIKEANCQPDGFAVV